jgi:hypothetical protein
MGMSKREAGRLGGYATAKVLGHEGCARRAKIAGILGGRPKSLTLSELNRRVQLLYPEVKENVEGGLGSSGIQTNNLKEFRELMNKRRVKRDSSPLEVS